MADCSYVVHAISNEMHWTGLAGVQTNTCAACSLADVTNAWSSQDAGGEKDSAGRWSGKAKATST